MDGNGTLFGTLSGNTREILHKFTVDLPKKHGRGGQSALRFARLRMEKRHNYVRKVRRVVAAGRRRRAHAAGSAAAPQPVPAALSCRSRSASVLNSTPRQHLKHSHTPPRTSLPSRRRSPTPPNDTHVHSVTRA